MTDHADVIRQGLVCPVHQEPFCDGNLNGCATVVAAHAALDALVAERDALARRLRDAPLGGEGSHWDGCWRSHIDCAVARIKELEAALRPFATWPDRFLRPGQIAATPDDASAVMDMTAGDVKRARDALGGGS